MKRGAPETGVQGHEVAGNTNAQSRKRPHLEGRHAVAVIEPPPEIAQPNALILVDHPMFAAGQPLPRSTAFYPGFDAYDPLYVPSIKVASVASVDEVGTLGRKTLGTGSFGTVSRLTNAKSRKDIAIKKYSWPRDGIIELAHLMMLGTGPHIVPLVATIANSASLLMPVALGDLQQGAGEQALRIAMNEADRRSLCRQLAIAVAYCHSRGVIHRDIKPGNCLIYPNASTSDALRPDSYWLCLADFGAARTFVSRQQPRALSKDMYTICYRPPEVLISLGEEYATYAASADVWAAGATMASIITKQRQLFPSMQNDEEGVMIQRISDVIAPPRSEILRERIRTWIKGKMSNAGGLREVLFKRFAIDHDAYDDVMLSSISAARQRKLAKWLAGDVDATAFHHDVAALLFSMLRMEPEERPLMVAVARHPVWDKYDTLPTVTSIALGEIDQTEGSQEDRVLHGRQRRPAVQHGDWVASSLLALTSADHLLHLDLMVRFSARQGLTNIRTILLASQFLDELSVHGQTAELVALADGMRGESCLAIACLDVAAMMSERYIFQTSDYDYDGFEFYKGSTETHDDARDRGAQLSDLIVTMPTDYFDLHKDHLLLGEAKEIRGIMHALFLLSAVTPIRFELFASELYDVALDLARAYHLVHVAQRPLTASLILRLVSSKAVRRYIDYLPGQRLGTPDIAFLNSLSQQIAKFLEGESTRSNVSDFIRHLALLVPSLAPPSPSQTEEERAAATTFLTPFEGRRNFRDIASAPSKRRATVRVQ